MPRTHLLVVTLVLSGACRPTPSPAPAAAPSPRDTAAGVPGPSQQPGASATNPFSGSAAVTSANPSAAPDSVLVPAAPACRPADWSARALAPLLKPGKTPNPKYADRATSATGAFDPLCSDHPDGTAGVAAGGAAVVIDGVSVRVKSAIAAGVSGRGWSGNQCTLEVALADGAGRSVQLGPEVVPPFNSVTAVARAGSAAWLEVSFNGYSREFPKGGNRIIAVDLCEGRAAWKSNDNMSNGGLLLLDDYLIAAYGFTSERRHVHVLDARSGTLIQKLPVLENVCPSKAWAPNWDGGRCDAPGQTVGAANHPRIEAGLFLVDTNTGSAAFELR